jgi:UDP-N-acetylglucosamine enolpyruvyl transferase
MTAAFPSAALEPEVTGLTVRRMNGLHGADVVTEPYPGFPTDMRASVDLVLARPTAGVRFPAGIPRKSLGT